MRSSSSPWGPSAGWPHSQGWAPWLEGCLAQSGAQAHQRQHRRELPHGQPCSEGFLSRTEGYERLGGGSSFGSHRGLCLVTTTQPSTALAFELHVGPHGKVVLGVILPAGAQDVAVGTEVSVHRENQVY